MQQLERSDLRYIVQRNKITDKMISTIGSALFCILFVSELALAQLSVNPISKTLGGSNPPFTPMPPGLAESTQTDRSQVANGTGSVRPASKKDGNVENDTYTWQDAQDDARSEAGVATLQKEFDLDQSYPNPFNPTTWIHYTLHNPGQVTLKIYNMLGNEVAMLVNASQEAGEYTVSFNSNSGVTSLSSGIYFYRLEAGEYISMKRLTLTK